MTVVDPENHRLACTNRMPKWLMSIERCQWLTTTEDGQTKYETIEAFNGWVAYIVKWFLGAKLFLSFRAMGEDLKRRSEQPQQIG